MCSIKTGRQVLNRLRMRRAEDCVEKEDSANPLDLNSESQSHIPRRQIYIALG